MSTVAPSPSFPSPFPSEGDFTTRWWWVRHAPVTENKGKIYGNSDLSCDCDDRILFEHAAKILPHPAILITSHLRRTIQTADAIKKAGYKDFSGHIQEAAFAEQDMGDWQGKTRDEIGLYDRALDERFWLTPDYSSAPNGESFADICARVGKKILKYSWDYQNQDIVAVAHNGTIRAALVQALNIAPSAGLRFVIDNVSVTRIDFIHMGKQHFWRLANINDTPNDRGWKRGHLKF